MNKIALITGGAKGIGKTTASLFAANGYTVVVNYNTSRSSAEEFLVNLHENNFSGMIVKADVSDRRQVDSMVDKVLDAYGHIDVLINNAGIAQQKLFTDISEDEWNRMFSVNVHGIFHTSQSVLPNMLARKSGKIINISSVWGIVGASCEVHYSAAKAAVIGLSKALAKEVGPSNISVNCVAPGVIDTGMIAGLNKNEIQDLIEQTPLQKLGTADDIAELLLYLASEKADFITGQVISPNGGFVI